MKAWLSRLPFPTRRGVIAAAAATGLILVLPAPWGLTLWIVLTLLAVAVDAALSTAPRAIQVTRQLPASIQLERTAELRWVVHNPGGRDVTVRLADDLVPSLRARRRADLRVPAGGRATASTPLHPARRGAIGLHALTVRVHGPLGLAARQATRTLDDRIDVLPAFRSRDQVALRLDHDRVLEVGRRAARGRSAGTEFEALREYRPDDEFRRIDWAATARAGQPIVRTYRPERNQNVLLLLDTGRVSAGLVEGVPRLDHAMDAVLAVTTAAVRLGDRTGLVAFGGGVRRIVSPSAGRDLPALMARAMYELEPELAESDYAGAFARTVGRFRRRSLLILLTDLGSGAVADTLLPALPVLLRRHLVVVAGVADPALQPASHPVVHAGDAYRLGATLELQEERVRTVARLRSRGAAVVEGPPSELAGHLVDHYLDVKSTGRL